MISNCSTLNPSAVIALLIFVGITVLIIAAPRKQGEASNSLGMAVRRLKIGGALIALLGASMMGAALIFDIIPERYGEWGEGTAVFGLGLLAYGFIKGILLKKFSNQ